MALGVVPDFRLLFQPGDGALAGDSVEAKGADAGQRFTVMHTHVAAGAIADDQWLPVLIEDDLVVGSAEGDRLVGSGSRLFCERQLVHGLISLPQNFRRAGARIRLHTAHRALGTAPPAARPPRR